MRFPKKSTPSFFLLILTIQFSYQLNEHGCMIDQCANCDFTNVYTCNKCKGGYYLKKFYSDERKIFYHDCWSKAKFDMAVLGLLALAITQCCCVYYCYRRGLTIIKVPHAEDPEVHDERQVEDQGEEGAVVMPSQVYDNQGSSFKHVSFGGGQGQDPNYASPVDYNRPGRQPGIYYPNQSYNYQNRRSPSYGNSSSKNRGYSSSYGKVRRKKSGRNKRKNSRRSRSRSRSRGRNRSRSRSRSRGRTPEYRR